MAEGDSNFTNVVASGGLTVSGLATVGTVALGGATSGGKPVGGLSDPTTNASGTTQNTEYTLNSVTLPAGAFNGNGRSVRVIAWGTLAANANAKNLKVYFGGTAVATVTGSTANGKDYYIELSVVRTGSSTQSGVGRIQVDTGTSATMAANGAIAENDANAIVIAVKSANTAAAAASATGKGMAAVFTN
ncbi:MAG TPA: hypothetical protein VHE55_11150 [Fimbriimonadaceae bacterium]|nr:hypothetical protein [Fimbriimonadaceae bacterium]